MTCAVLWFEKVGALGRIGTPLFPISCICIAFFVDLFVIHLWLETNRALAPRGYSWLRGGGALYVALNLRRSALRQLPPCEELSLIPGYRENDCSAFIDLVAEITRDRKTAAPLDP